MSSDEKNILVLARRDPEEAMRFAAGLTIFGHEVRLIFMGRPLKREVMESETAELLDLTDIEPQTTVKEMREYLELLTPSQLGRAIEESHGVINI